MDLFPIIILVFLLLFAVYAWSILDRLNDKTSHNFGEPCGKYDHCIEGTYCNEKMCLPKHDIPVLKEIINVDLVTVDELYLNEENQQVILTKHPADFKWNYDPLNKIIFTDDGRFLSIIDNKLYLGPVPSILYLFEHEHYYYIKDDKFNYLFIDCSKLPWSVNVSLPSLSTKPLIVRTE